MRNIKFNAEILMLILILSLNIFLRFYNIGVWQLIKGDEMDTMANLGEIDFGVDPASNYLLTIGLTKTFFFIKSFPEYRYTNAIMFIFSIILTFLSAKILLNDKKKIFLLLIFVSFCGQFLDISKLFLVDWSDIFISSLILFLFFKFQKTQNNVFLVLILISLALGLNNHGTMIYTSIPFLGWLLYLISRNKIQLNSLLVFGIILSLILTIPFLKALLNVPHEWIEVRYNVFGLAFDKPILPNLIRLDLFLQNLSQWFISFKPYEPTLPFLLSIFLTLLIVIFPLYKIFKNYHTLNENLKFLAWQTYGIILVMLFSPLPIYHPTTFSHLFIPFSLLIFNLSTIGDRYQKIIIFIILMILFFNINQTIWILEKNGYRDLLEFKNYLIKNNITELSVGEYANKILSFYNFYNGKIKYQIFTCTETGINPENIFLNYTSSKNSIVIFDSACDYSDSRIKLNATVQPVQSIDDLRVYKIIYE